MMMSPRQQRPAAVRAVRPVQHRAAGEVAAAADQGEARRDLAGVAVPEHDRPIVAHDPLAVGGMEIDRHAAERAAPVHHRGVVVRVGDRDAAHAAERLDGGHASRRPPG